MSESDANLLRDYAAFIDSPEDGPLVCDLRAALTDGTEEQRTTVALYMKTHMESVLARRAELATVVP